MSDNCGLENIPECVINIPHVEGFCRIEINMGSILTSEI